MNTEPILRPEGRVGPLGPPASLPAGIHHLGTLTADMKRLIGFRERVCDARVTLDLRQAGLRHLCIELGPATVLHPVQVPDVEVPQGDVPLVARGRLDPLGSSAATDEAFLELRRRVLAEGAVLASSPTSARC